jgi:hypothetical protein
MTDGAMMMLAVVLMLLLRSLARQGRSRVCRPPLLLTTFRQLAKLVDNI